MRLALIPARRRQIAAALLFVGLAASLAILLAARTPNDDSALPGPENSKQYLRQLEYVGGQSNVFATEATQWLTSLWHGPRLAATTAVLTVLVVLMFLVASTPLPASPQASPPPQAHDHTR